MVDVLPQLIKLKGAALNLLFPQYCVGCGREGAFICPECAAVLPYIDTAVCPRCGIPESGGALCRSCLHWQADIDGIRAPFKFEGVIREAVHQLKYQNLRAISFTLAEMLRDYLNTNPIAADLIIPVPLHPKRLRERGYNQSALLAQELSRMISVPVDEKSLTRNKYTLPQARTANVIERHRNVAGLFTCAAEDVKGKNILVLDDVTTTGATLNACATAIKTAGAASVWGQALAKEISKMEGETMELQITGHNVEILPTVRSYVEKKLGKINRHFTNIKSAKIELMELKARGTKYRFRAQVTVEADGLLLRAEENGENLLVAVDKVVPSLDRQIERFKGKTYKKNKASISGRGKAIEAPVTEKDDAPQVVRTKRFPVRMMTVEEAIRQMELLGHDFFLFNNGVTKELNLLYRRKDGNYSVIEPELK